MMNYKAVARKIRKAVGGRGNILMVNQCATRLRFHLKDQNKIKYDILNQMDEIAMTLKRGSEFQILPKAGTSDIYQELTKITLGVKLFGDFWP